MPPQQSKSHATSRYGASSAFQSPRNSAFREDVNIVSEAAELNRSLNKMVQYLAASQARLQMDVFNNEAVDTSTRLSKQQ